MQFRLFHDLDFYKSEDVKSVLAYHNPNNPADDQLYFCFYLWDCNTLVSWREGVKIQIDNIDILLNNEVRALPYFSAQDVTPASSIPAVIDSRPVHPYNLVYFRLDSLLEIFNEADSMSVKSMNSDAMSVATQGAKFSRGRSTTLTPEDRKPLFFTHSNVKFPNLRATMSYSPLDNFKTLVATHEKTNVTNPTQRENMAVEVGVPCPPRWDEGIAAVATILSGNKEEIDNLVKGYKNTGKTKKIGGITYRLH